MAEQHHQNQQPGSYRAVKAATAATAGGSLLGLSGLTLAGTVIALTVATPLLVLFSPVLVPAVNNRGAFDNRVLGVRWVRCCGGYGDVVDIQVRNDPPGADQLDQARHKFASKVREMKDKAEQFGHQHLTAGGQRQGS